jgi:hypothetical protein
MDSLHAFPKLAESVGQYMASFAALEMLLWCLYGKVVNSNMDGAMAMLGHIESFALKLTAIENFVIYSGLSDEHKKAAREFFVIARECNAFRNSLAHGLYLSDDDGTRVELVSYASSANRKPKQRELTFDLLKTETGKILDLRDAIRKAFFPEFDGAHRPKHIR